MIQISLVPPERRAEALRLFFQELPLTERGRQVETVLASVSQGELCLDGLLMAEADGELVGVTLFSPQPDDVAFLWSPKTRNPMQSSLRIEVEDRLLQSVGERLASTEVWLEQCLLEPEQKTDQEVLSRNGFIHLADLLFMQRELLDPIPTLPEKPLRETHYDKTSPECVDRFSQVMEQTYVNSLDCPLLHQRLTGKQALKTHEHSGIFDPRLWTLFETSTEHENPAQTVGILILSRHPETCSFEVCYLGVCPEFRGKGYGREMLITGLHQAKNAEQDSVFLAVDTRNHYAEALYSQLGFMELCQRTVLGRLRD